jgi:hypothetical protein
MGINRFGILPEPGLRAEKMTQRRNASYWHAQCNDQTDSYNYGNNKWNNAHIANSHQGLEGFFKSSAFFDTESKAESGRPKPNYIVFCFGLWAVFAENAG